MPALDKCVLMRVIRHEALGHFTGALRALHLCDSHIAVKMLRGWFRGHYKRPWSLDVQGFAPLPPIHRVWGHFIFTINSKPKTKGQQE
jgi:hypothetical protein